MRHSLALPPLLAAIVTTTACAVSYPAGPPLDGEEPPAEAPRVATLGIHVTDSAPSPDITTVFDEVWIELREIAVATSAGWQRVSQAPHTLGLLSVARDTACIAGAFLPPGTADRVRVIIDGAHASAGGAYQDIALAGDSAITVELPLGAALEVDTEYKLVLDFHAAGSLLADGERWVLQPALSVQSMAVTPPAPIL